MLITDPRGLALTAGDARSGARLEAALLDVLGFAGDPVGRTDEALAADPDLALGHLLRADIFLFALQPGFAAKAAPSLSAARALAGRAGERERLHLAASEAWARGDLAGSIAAFDALLERCPRDLMALMFAHQADFFSGRADGLDLRTGAALAAWAPDLPGYGFVSGMHAFALEEAGRYGEAEALGRTAVAGNPRDVWAIHAVGHVLEMQGRDEEGIAWYESRESDWAVDSYFAVHNAWHLALYHVDRADAAAALAVYDRFLRPGRRSLLLNLCDAAALLWRLRLLGVELGDRTAELAELVLPHLPVRLHVFDDVHVALALAADDRHRELGELEGALAAAAAGGTEYAAMVRRVGFPTARAVSAFARGEHAAAAALLSAVRPQARLMTGSRAQRDVIELTLIEALIRAGELGAAAELLEPRHLAKPMSAQVRRDIGRCHKRV